MSNHEGFTARVVRHLKQGFDLDTIRSGATELYDLIGAKYGYLQLAENKNSENYLGIQGLDVKDLLYTSNLFPMMRRSIRIVDLPHNITARCVVNNGGFNTQEAATAFANQNTVFSFTGPTFLNSFPNNGFYSSKHGVVVPFGEVPIGETRGAIAITNEGELQILDDDSKRVVLSDEEVLASYSAIAGCSNIIKMDEDTDMDGIEPTHSLSPMSYIGQYEFRDGSIRTSYFVTTATMTRDEVQMHLFAHMGELGATSAMFAELELKNAGATVIGNGVDHFGGKFKTRSDYWFVDRATS